jgi:hypothetical protein
MRIKKLAGQHALRSQSRAQNIDEHGDGFAAILIMIDQRARRAVHASKSYNIEPRRFDAEFGVKRLGGAIQLLTKQTQQLARVAFGLTQTDLDRAIAAVDAEQMQCTRARAGAAAIETLDDIGA